MRSAELSESDKSKCAARECDPTAHTSRQRSHDTRGRAHRAHVHVTCVDTCGVSLRACVVCFMLAEDQDVSCFHSVFMRFILHVRVVRGPDRVRWVHNQDSRIMRAAFTRAGSDRSRGRGPAPYILRPLLGLPHRGSTSSGLLSFRSSELLRFGPIVLSVRVPRAFTHQSSM